MSGLLRALMASPVVVEEIDLTASTGGEAELYPEEREAVRRAVDRGCSTAA